MLRLLNLFIILISLLVQPIGEDYPYREGLLCDPIIEAYGGTEVPWIGYPEGWDLPDDLVWLHNDHYAGGDALWTFSSASNPDKLYKVYLFDKLITCDESGNYCGFHHICQFTTSNEEVKPDDGSTG